MSSQQHLTTHSSKRGDQIRDDHANPNDHQDYQDLRDKKGQEEAQHQMPRKEKSKKHKKKQKEWDSDSSSERCTGEDDDNDNKSKSKKKASAAVLTRINIFTGTPGAPGIGVENTQTCPKTYSATSGPKQLQATRQTAKPARDSRRSKKPATPTGRQPMLTTVEGGEEGQEVLLIPIPPGMKYTFTGVGSMQQQMER
ncbi:Top1 protein, putative [Ixodes scapularis]|uniref:Top1 protein, putative n=1 Tax=Ixodes scapularis TaxID=6945 RepID=B7PPG1_IXOSC|nr:Top1 protein, putative [Ixodes scapularis]|eukprot:XP_002435653.1 Top1 protein, putative [Ixodes scapularis]